MNRNLLLFFVIGLAMAFAVGCAQEQPSPPEEEPPPTVEAPEREPSAIDPNVLPAPRQAPETAPDLSNGLLEINEVTLAKMANDGVPQNVRDALRSMQGQAFTNATEFAEAVRQAAPGSDAYLDTILRDALVTTLDDPPPAPGAAPMVAGGPFQIIYFDFDKSNIKPEFVGAIQDNAKYLLDNPGVTVRIDGHCDERGTNEYNLALGQRRANSVRRALIAEGVPANRLEVKTFGEELPVALGHNEEAWAKNRRGEFVVLSQ